MYTFMTMTRANLLMTVRNRAAMFWTVVFPIAMLIFYGAIWGQAQFGQVSAMAWLTISVVVFTIVSNGLLGDAARLTNYRERGILQRIRTTPLPAWQLILSYSLTRLLVVLVESIAIFAIAIVVFHAHYTVAGLLMTVPLVLLGGVVFLAIGQLISALAPNSATASAVGQTLFFPLMFISGIIPIDALPAWAVNISVWLPTTMLGNLLRPILLATPAPSSAAFSLIGLAAYSLIPLALAARFFRWEART